MVEAAHEGTPQHLPWTLPFSLRRRDSLLPINYLGKRYAETAEKPAEFDLSFAGPETASFRPRGQKPRAYSLGMNLYSPTSEYRPVPCRPVIPVAPSFRRRLEASAAR